ncbi:Cell polarity protein alp11 [Cyberlindnera fabianii]|uniref:Cell polarity protein alp11 n=1 Tax=Cyberlindnera fabianii TaxID=36022 RepID=A0A1V2LDX5_CYBFA|nr:Cell polarity protein alp11 [Cyberlindnera fabianii]
MADISVNVTSSLTNSERRVSRNWTLTYFQQRLEAITGIPPDDQQVLLFHNTVSTENSDLTAQNRANRDSVTLSMLNVQEGARIHVNDTRPESELKDLEDDSNTKFFELDDAEYEKRSDTVRRWKQENKLGRFAPEYEQKKAEVKHLNEEKAKELTIGSRFRTVNDPVGERRGTIRYVGKVLEIDADNTWCGVEFDEPVGKNNGSIKGVYYFHAKPSYGGFLKPQQIETGDFPEQSLFSDDDEL